MKQYVVQYNNNRNIEQINYIDIDDFTIISKNRVNKMYYDIATIEIFNKHLT